MPLDQTLLWTGAGAMVHPHAISGSRLKALADISRLGGTELPEHLKRVVTPLKKAVWEREKEDHPDKTLVQQVLQGIEEGFQVGYDAGRLPLRSE